MRPSLTIVLCSFCLLLTQSLAGATEKPPTAFDGVRQLLREGKYADAAASARNLLQVEEARSGPDSLQTVEVIDFIVEAERLDGKVKDEGVQALARRSIAIREAALGADHPDVARSVNNLANLLVESGDYFSAKPLYDRVLAIQDAKLDPADPLIAKTLTNFANLISDMGDYVGSGPLYERALEIKTKAYGAEDPQLISTLVGLAILKRLTGDYTGARDVCDRAMRIADLKLRPDHPRRAVVMATSAGIARETGDFAEARKLLQGALAIQEKELGPDHPDTAATLGDIASLDKEAGDLESARSLYERSLGAQAVSLEAESAYLVPNMTNLGEVLLALGNREGAKTQLEHGLRIRESQFGPDHPDVADSLSALAALEEKQGDLTAAKDLLERGLRIRETALGPSHPLVASSLARLAQVAARAGQGGTAIDFAHRAETIGRRHLRLIVRALPERQALRYAATRPAGLDLELELVGERPSDAWVRIAWDDLIRGRALVLDEMAARNRSVRAREDSTSRLLRTRLAAARAQEAALWVKGLVDQDPKSYTRVLDDAREQEEKAEKELAERSLPFRVEQKRENVGLQEIAKALPPESALVAFALSSSLDSGSEGGSEKYTAFVLGPASEVPRAVSLGDARTIDGLVDRWRTAVSAEPSPVPAITSIDEKKSRDLGARLRAAIWDPVTEATSGARYVFIVPDGTLNLINFAALPIGADRYLVETEQMFHYLSAETDLLSEGSPRTESPSLLAVGGPDYDGMPSVVAAARTPTSGALRGPAVDCRDPGSLRFEPLPGAKREVDEIGAIWLQKGPERAGSFVSLVGGQATKVNVERLAPQHTYVHLATHGYLFDEQCFRGKAGLQEQNPLLLSGLAFAGANRRPAASPLPTASSTKGAVSFPAADAILTAEEIASLDLSRVSWLVLSGCETGLGKFHRGEGILGLRRAVQVAGASTLIMSLWKTKDDPTRVWMRHLYERRLSGMPTAEAVRAASVDILAERRAQHDSAHPFFWGAFVAAGDWR
jgi:CHAT domain-containing protein/tetratricopeptide (TPR) repeat protein